MSWIKKIIIALLVLALIAGGTVGALNYMKNSNQTEVMVTSVSSLANEYYSPSTTLDGNIVTNVSQSISVDKDMIIEEVYVQQGDEVKEGDKLISFDMTLVEMELEIAKLKHQKLENDLNKAVNRLNRLKNGGPITEDDYAGTADNLDSDWSNSDDGDIDDDMASISGSLNGNYLAAAMQPLLLAAFTDDVLEDETSAPETPAQEASSETESNINDSEVIYQDPSIKDFSADEPEVDSPEKNFSSGENDAPKPTPEPTPVLDPDSEFIDSEYREDEVPGLSDGEPTFYQVLDYNTEPFEGSGTEDDPYIFLCSSAKGKVTVMGSFFNKMAGYNEDGTRVVQEGGSWFQLEFHQYDTITDFLDRRESCIGYYLMDGSLLENPVNMYIETELTIDGAMQYEDDGMEEPEDPGMGNNGTTISRADAIKAQERMIATLKLDIQESDMNIAKLEKKVDRQVIYSKLDGTVAYVGDPVTGTTTEDAFIKVKSKDGYYVKGTVSELLLDQVTEGTILNCMSYENGAFKAKVVEVSEYPTDSDNYYYSDGNPNVSYYTFSATIMDESMKVSDMDWINITLESDAATKGSIVLSKAFVKTENGVSYVYKDDNGVLKKQVVTVGASVDSGYSVMIKAGITKNDKIAFPYGSTAKEGAKTKEVGLDEMYGY